MADPNGKRTDGAPPSHIHIEKKTTNWLVWLLLALGVLAALLAISRYMHRDAVDTTTTTSSTTVVAETPNAPKAAALVGTARLAGYLASTQATPQTFTFDKLNFETAKSTIRPSDMAGVNEVAAALKQYPNAKVRVAGYADTRGTEAANVVLGKARADSVKAAIVAAGIDGSRIDAVTGGTGDPVDTNATVAGRAENRRTELVVTQR